MNIKRVFILFYFCSVIFGNISQVKAGDTGESAGKPQPEGATALDPQDVTLYCEALSNQEVITCLFGYLDYFSQNQFLEVVSHNTKLEQHTQFLKKVHDNTCPLRFHQLSEFQNGLYLLKHNQKEVEVKGVKLPPDFRVFEYALPPGNVIRIHVVSIDQSEVFVDDCENSDEEFEGDFYDMFVVISRSDEPEALSDHSDTPSENTVVGFLQGAPVDDSVDPDGKEGELLLAPSWEALITSLHDWQVESLIDHLNADKNVISELSGLFRRDKEECKKRLILFLNRLMVHLPDEPLHDAEEAVSVSETASVSETSLPEVTDEESCWHCDDDLTDHAANPEDRRNRINSGFEKQESAGS